MLGFQCAGGSRNSLIAFSALEVDSKSSILGVNSTAAAVAWPVDIDAMMGYDDAAAAEAAAPAAARAAASAAEAEAD